MPRLVPIAFISTLSFAAASVGGQTPLVTFASTSSLDGGFNGSITIENRGDTAINDWTLAWDGGPAITSLWNGVWSVDGDHTTVTDVGWNSVIAAGGSVALGFGANGTLQENVNTCTLNGAACEVAYEGTSDGGGDDGGGVFSTEVDNPFKLPIATGGELRFTDRNGKPLRGMTRRPSIIAGNLAPRELLLRWTDDDTWEIVVDD